MGETHYRGASGITPASPNGHYRVPAAHQGHASSGARRLPVGWGRDVADRTSAHTPKISFSLFQAGLEKWEYLTTMQIDGAPFNGTRI
jgi:hypothetical protein